MHIEKIELTNNDYKSLSDEIGSVFNSLEWLSLFEPNKLQLYGIFNKEKLIGAFYLYKHSLKGLTYLKSPQYTPNCGLFFENKTGNKSKYNSTNKKILALIADYMSIDKYSVMALSFPKNDQFTDVQPFLWKRFKASPTYTYILKLNKTEAEFKKDFSSNLKSDLSRAAKDDILVEKCSDYSIVKELVLQTFDRQELKLNHTYLDKVLFEFANESNSFAFVSYRNGLPIATAFCIYKNGTAYYLLGGYDADNKHRGAGPSAVFASILHAKELGLEAFDFEGSSIPDIERYFRGFGGEIIHSFSIHKAKLPIEMALKFIKRNIY